jgi:hypothetical protein
MIARKIVYFFFLSASWRSVVSWNRFEINVINQYLAIAEAADDWTAVYNRSDQPTLDAFFSECVNHLGYLIDSYVNNLNIFRVMNGPDIPPPRPDPDLNGALCGVRQLIYLLGYSNFRILIDLKQALQAVGPIDLPAILEVITDQSALDWSGDYARIRARPTNNWVEIFTIDVAVLYSLNKAMLIVLERHRPEVRSRLELYQTMIDHLHLNLSRYMRTQTRFRYFERMQALANSLFRLREHGIQGYAHPLIRYHFKYVSTQILSVIVIYGTLGTEGSEKFSELLEEEEEIRRFMRLDPTPVTDDEEFSHLLLVCLRRVIRYILDNDRPANDRWYDELIRMANHLMRLGRGGFL